MKATLTFAASVLLLVSASAAARAAEEKQAPRFYYDLGPDSIDVSAYPEVQRAEYPLFTKTCARCHTLARPINSPYVTREDWGRFVHRMHDKTTVVRGTAFGPRDRNAIIDFLAYDAKVRKVDGKREFGAQTERLKSEFEAWKTQHAKAQQAADRKKVKEPPMPGVGVKPRP